MENVTTLKLNLDASEAVKGLKQLQREARKTVQALREVEQVCAPNRDVESAYKTYLAYVFELCGKKDVEPKYINRQLYDAIVNDEFRKITIHYKRCSGATISAVAAVKTFDDVVLVTSNSMSRDRLRYLGATRIFSIDERWGGIDEIRDAKVVIFDDRMDEFDLIKHHPYKGYVSGKRFITLYGHDCDC